MILFFCTMSFKQKLRKAKDPTQPTLFNIFFFFFGLDSVHLYSEPLSLPLYFGENILKTHIGVPFFFFFFP